MTIRLRPHHLLCMLTYVGKGYTPDFTANYDVIVARLGAGEAIEIVAGPDDICAPLLAGGDHHCHNDSVVERDRLAGMDVADVLGLDAAIGPGARLVIDRERLENLRRAFAQEVTRSACGGCEWSALCTGIAAKGFAAVRLTA